MSQSNHYLDDSTATPDPQTTSTPETYDQQPLAVTKATAPSTGARLNPRSCVTCRRRKVRCNKEEPCANCVKAGIDCVFPAPGRAPRKSRRPPDTELLARLRRLEGVVQSLGVQPDSVVENHRTVFSKERRSSQTGSEGSSEGTKRGSIDKPFGRLVINDDRSRYVSNSFWTGMGEEIAEMRDILEPSSEDDDEEHTSPDKAASEHPAGHHGFILGYSSLMTKLKQLHPTPSQTFILWEIYKDNVDPCVRLLHRPVARNVLMNASANADGLSKPAEALVFAIYFAAVVSLSEDQCRALLDQPKAVLINRFRFAVEQALARADFLNSSSLMLLQAFVLFLIVVRHQDDSRLVWSLGGLALHLAQALGIHRDGTNFGLNAFDTEMRRRLWWHVSVLDNRAAEDHGVEPTFSESFYDTKFPQNIHDDDIQPGQTKPPAEREGFTEMTFCLIRFELSVVSRKLNLISAGTDPALPERTVEEKEELIEACHKMMEEKYFQHCDMSQPIQWVSATVGRLILAKMWLMAHHPMSYSKTADASAVPSGIRDRLFNTSVEVIEFACLLERSDATKKWGWLFRTYMQWHAVAFVLSELIARPPGPDVDRAWTAIDMVYDQNLVPTARGAHGRNQNGMLWRPLKTLLVKAKANRAKQLNGTMKGLHGVTNTSPSTFASDTIDARHGQWFISATAEAMGMDLGSDANYWEASQESMQDVQIQPPAYSTYPVPHAMLDTTQTKSVHGVPPVLSPHSSGSDLTPDFLNWASWAPDVGDFTLGGSIPSMEAGFVNNVQHEWFQ